MEFIIFYDIESIKKEMEFKKRPSVSEKKHEYLAQKLNNKTRTSLLVRVASEIDKSLKLSTVMINSMNPREIAKKFEVVVRLENPFYFDSSTPDFCQLTHLVNSAKSKNNQLKVKCVVPLKRNFHSEKQSKEIEIKKKASKSNNTQLSGLLDNLTCQDFLSFISNYNLNLQKRSQLLENINNKRINIAKRKFEHNRMTFKYLKEKDAQQPQPANQKVTRKVSCLKSNINKTQFQFKRSITNLQQNSLTNSLTSQKIFDDLIKKAREQKMSKAIKFIFLSKEEQNIKKIQGNYNYLHRLSDFLKFDKKLVKSDLYETEIPNEFSKDVSLTNPKLKLASKSKDLIFPTELFEILEFKGISFEGISSTHTKSIKPSATLVFCSDDPDANCLLNFPKQRQLSNLIDTLSKEGSILESPLIKQYAKRNDIHLNIRIESKTSINFNENCKIPLPSKSNERDFHTKAKNCSNDEYMKRQHLDDKDKLIFASSQSDISD